MNELQIYWVLFSFVTLWVFAFTKWNHSGYWGMKLIISSVFGGCAVVVAFIFISVFKLLG